MDRAEFLRLIGPLPSKVPLEPRVLESRDCGSYVREKVEYSVEAGDRVRAYVLIPKNAKQDAPALFCHHQHDGNYVLGKSEVVGLGGDPEQALAVDLVERGYVTFAPDAIAFEERNWAGENSNKSEYFELATRLVRGQTLLAKVLHDVAVGLDYLQGRPEVDKMRLGFIGHSYGGRMALWAPAFDRRLRASVSNCGCVNYKDSLTRDVGIQMEFCVPDFLRHGDIEDVVKLVEPCSLFISATDDDVWSRGAEAIYGIARPAFVRGTFKAKVWPGKHCFNGAMKQEAYAFLDAQLMGSPH